MTRLVARLILSIAVLLMPFGMTAAPAAAHDAMARMPMEHCPDQAPGHAMKGGIAECTMACAAALPATEAAAADAPLDPVAPTVAAPLPLLHGLHPETATPPPRIS